eukprot:c24521_g1_i1 orf=129-1514(-)
MEKLSRSSRSRTLLVRWLLLPFLLASAGLLHLLFSSSAPPPLSVHSPLPSRKHEPRFLEVPQIAWGLNNQKIALARALLTARFLNRSLLLPSLSASLTYKDTSRILPLPFDRLFSLPRFNELCKGFVSIAHPPAHFLQQHSAFNISKGSGRRWTKDRDLQQLLECREPEIHRQALLRVSGKNPFLWHDHWTARDYAKIFRCFVLVENISAEVDLIVSKLKQTSFHLSTEQGMRSSAQNTSDFQGFGSRGGIQRSNGHGGGHGMVELGGYVAVHMRIEKDWMIHCKKTEDRVRMRQGKLFNICSSKQEIIDRVSHIPHMRRPSLAYLAVADVLLEDTMLLEGWQDGLVPFEKKKLGLLPLYKKYPYLIQSALDYEVCLRADVFVGNSFSTFSSLIALERTLKMLESRPADPCSGGTFPSFAYNVEDISGGPQLWVTNLSDVSLQAISYGTDQISCNREMGSL